VLSACARTDVTVGQLDEFVRLARLLSELVDDTICSVYRPQVRETVRANATKLCATVTRLAQLAIELVPATDVNGDAKTLRLIVAKADASLQSLPP